MESGRSFNIIFKIWLCNIRQGDFLIEPEETGHNFIENALLKAKKASRCANMVLGR